MPLSNAERQARWRERRAEQIDRAGGDFEAYQCMAAWIIKLRADIEQKSEKLRDAPEYKRLVDWIEYELGAMVPPVRKCLECGYTHRRCDRCGQDQKGRYVTP